MIMANDATGMGRSFKADEDLKRKLPLLCRTDNITNWYYIARAYLLIALSVGATLATWSYLRASDASLWWLAPVWLLSVLVIGASQHQLAGATHEATHHTLFKNRLLNELVSDWLCMFPLYSTTYAFRLYHLVHHQFVNDPERDPDFVVLEKSGHWLRFPVTATKFFLLLLKQMLLLPLMRYVLVRAKYNSLGVEGAGPYKGKQQASRIAERIGLAWMLGLIALEVALYYFATPLIASIVPVVYWLTLAGIYLSFPARLFPTARIKPVLSRKTIAISRTFFLMALFTTLTVSQMLSGQPLWWVYVALWVVPLTTTFPFFMILRQIVQHGNGDRGWLTNTRVFLVNPAVRYAVFPFGMDYHLPHHMYASVPHYNLPALHQLLSNYEEYSDEGLEVHNYVIPETGSPRHPTVVEVLGSRYARNSEQVYIDDSVLDACEVEGVDEPAELATCSSRPPDR